MDFETTIEQASFILAEGSVIERLRRNPGIQLDPHVLNAGLIYREPQRSVLAGTYRQYLDVGRAYELPMIVLTPTWRANRQRLQEAGFSPEDDVNGDCARFLASLRDEFGGYAERVFMGGLIGCKGDAYRPEEALAKDEAAAFHSFQVRALTAAGVDFLVASTLPALSEARGIAAAMAECGIPFFLSFVIRARGELLDGTPLAEAVATIDSEVQPRPLGYFVNCVHPSIFEEALERRRGLSTTIPERIIGLQANTSRLRPEELDSLDFLDSEKPEQFAAAMLRVHERFGIKILGGCCGTNHRHIESIAKKLCGR